CGVIIMSDIVFPDGRRESFPKGTTGKEIAASISPGLKKQAIAIKLDGVSFDFRREPTRDGTIEIVTDKNNEGMDVRRHSTAHLRAQAIKRLYKDAQFGVGPVIEEGFYYDIDMEHSLTPEDLITIEKEMQRIIDENLEIERIEVTREE